MNTKNIIMFLFGLGIGGFGTYFAMKQKMENTINAEVQEFKESYNYEPTDETIDDSVGVVPETEPTEENEEEYSEIIRKLNYNEYSTKPKQEEETPVKDDAELIDKNFPYVITVDQYLENDEFDKVTLYFFDEDYIFMNEDEDLIDAEDLLGAENLTEVSDEALYIRNENNGVDYEVILREGSYEEYVTNSK